MEKLYRDLAERLSGGVRLLPDKPEETLESTLRALWHAATGRSVSARVAGSMALPSLSSAEAERLRRLVVARIAGTPLAYLTGCQHFMGLDLLAGSEALIPRVETELLGWAALECLQRLEAASNHAALVVDVGTGSGNLALALAFHAPKARVYGADLSEQAVALARRNALHFRLQDRVEFRVGDLLTPFEEPEFLGGVDLLVCNPPYVSSGKVDTMPHEIVGHEPRLAFDGGALGIQVIERLTREAPRFLRSGGCLAFEVGLGQGSAILKRLSADGRYSRLRPIQDSAGAIRVIAAGV